MKIEKRNLKSFIERKIKNHESKNGLDVGTLLHVMDWIREYKPRTYVRFRARR